MFPLTTIYELDYANVKENCLTEVMFLATAARPWYDAHRKYDFNGKIGIWPFLWCKNLPKRNSST